MTVRATVYGIDCKLELFASGPGGVWVDASDSRVQVARISGSPETFKYLDGAICPKCKEPPTPEGYDACIGYVEGVTSACCGHGVKQGKS